MEFVEKIASKNREHFRKETSTTGKTYNCSCTIVVFTLHTVHCIVSFILFPNYWQPNSDYRTFSRIIYNIDFPFVAFDDLVGQK